MNAKRFAYLFASTLTGFGVLVLFVFFLSVQTSNAGNTQMNNLGDGWMQSNVNGFGDPLNSGITGLAVFENNIYAGTWNLNGAQIWRSSNGYTWSQITPSWSISNTAVNDTQVFGNYLYAGTWNYNTNGGEIWRTDGITWEQVVSGGFGNPNNEGINALAVFSSTLYATTINLDTGLELWRSSSGSAGDWSQIPSAWTEVTGNYAAVVMGFFDNFLYLGLSRNDGIAELWRSNDGENWNSVFIDGLGNPNNTNVSAIEAYNGYLYLGLRNVVEGGQVWRSSDGLNWSQVVSGGLGNPDNQRPYGLISYRGLLYLMLGNNPTGAEVWASADGATWQNSASGGWGDSGNFFADYFDKGSVVFNDSLFVSSFNDNGAEIWRLSSPDEVTLYVTTGGNNLENDCSNLSNPCRTVEHAVHVAKDGDIIQVAEGTYTGTTIAPLDAGPFTATVIITKNITLQGGFNTTFTENDPETYVTTLDGENQRGSVVGFLGSQASIDGFSIVNGSSPSGGGIFAGDLFGTPAVVTISNNIIANNHTITDTAYSGDGAGVLITLGTTAYVYNNQILSNTIDTDDGFGAGLSVRFGATAVISGNLVAYNQSHPDTNGGGINVYTATVQIINNTFQKNSKSGIDIYDSPSTLIANNTILSNTTTWNGGGIAAGESVVTITGNLIAYNVANSEFEGGGGIFIHNNSHALIENNEVLSNTGSILGGGISMIWGPTGTIRNNIVAYNYAGEVSGGIEIRECGQVTVTNNTVFANEALFGGGGILAVGNLEPTIITHNEVFANTTQDGGVGIAVHTTPAIVDGNLVYHNTALGWGSGIGVFEVNQPVTVTNNVVVTNTSNGIWTFFSTANIINNTVANNVHNGIDGWATIPITSTVYNNIAVNNEGCGILSTDSAELIVDYNDVQGNAADYCSEASGAHDISANPQFVNVATGDYHISYSSPAMDAGTSAYAPAYDKDGIVRPQGSGIDMGAYEVKLPVLNINYSTGQPGSFFTVTGLNFPITVLKAANSPNADATVNINGTILGTVQTDSSGSFLFVLDTSQADEGQYFVTVSSGNVKETVEFLLDTDEPLRPQEDTGPTFNVPEGIAIPIAHKIYLPVVIR